LDDTGDRRTAIPFCSTGVVVQIPSLFMFHSFPTFQDGEEIAKFHSIVTRSSCGRKNNKKSGTQKAKFENDELFFAAKEAKTKKKERDEVATKRILIG
jgi:hypothetical protein